MRLYANNRFASVLTATGLALFGGLPGVLAHHSGAEYDQSTVVEVRGEVVGVLWRNPHIRFQVSTEAFDGNDQPWEAEGRDLTSLARAGLSRDVLEVGDVITFAGNPSMRQERRMFATNLLLTDGREVLLSGRAQARWAPDRLVDPGAHLTAAAVPAVSADDGFIGKVYFPMGDRQAPAWVEDPPLTAEARNGQASYDEVVDDPVLGCTSPGMPRVMLRSGPYPIRFIERGSDLVLQSEWFGIDRVIHMNGPGPEADHPYTPLGYSVGEWAGETLVITTTRIDWPYFELYGLVGVPQSHAMRFVEWFTPLEGGAALRYGFSATDPAAFTETVTYENYTTFRWRPALEFFPYDCIEDER